MKKTRATSNSEKISRRELIAILKKAAIDKDTVLSLRDQGLRELPLEIGDLLDLRELRLESNFLTSLPKEIGQLKNLKLLDLAGNKLSRLPVEIGQLKGLKKLILRGNLFTSLPTGVEKLSELTELDISENKIGQFPEEFWDFQNLTSLRIGSANSDNNILFLLPAKIDRLSSLTEIDLSHLNLKHLPSEISNLINLTRISLNGNNLSKLPSQFSKLKKLKSLSLFDNQFEFFPEEILQLENLKNLGLAMNKINKIPLDINKLRKLENLYLWANKISEIPESLGDLKELKKLYLQNNEIEVLPASMLDIKKIETLNLTGNKLSIPPEILMKTDEPWVILNYYFSIVGHNRKSINEIKLLIVGQGSVGKTSLVRRILLNKFNTEEEKTEGISITRWLTENNSEIGDLTSKIKLNIWDFGGQEIMHATHQFFLTKRSLYLLVLDSRLTQEENRVEYWLKIIQSFGGESPVLIVGNKIDQHPLDIDRTGLQKKYPNIVGILETSAATGTGIEELKAAIAEQVNNLPHVRDLLPETWFTVKTKLEELGRQSNFITHDKYLELCAENEVSDETSQRTLIGFLHDLGVVLHFQDDPRLEALGILNPQWVTNGVYKILNSHILFQNKGVLTTSMLDEILNLPEYPRGKRLFIVDMMKKFELCYDIPYGYGVEPDKTFLVPDLLPKDEPAELKFKGVPAFEYAYPVLPSSVITRFIVRMNQKVDDGLVWRTGVVLKIGDNKALVKADIEDRKITIAIDGVEHTRRDALSAIRYQLDEIHGSIKGLNPEKRVPIPEAPNAEPIEYDYLLMLEREGQETHLVKDGIRLVKVNVRQVLSAIETENQRKEQGVVINNYYTASDGGVVVGGNVTGNLISGNNNKIIQDSYNKIKSADVDPELKQTLKSLTEAITVVVQSFPEEKTAKVMKNFERLVEESTQPEPDKQWYSVSIEGLIMAAENLDKLGEPVINLSQKVLSLLTGGVIK